jgi:hypothetical protein
MISFFNFTSLASSSSLSSLVSRWRGLLDDVLMALEAGENDDDDDDAPTQDPGAPIGSGPRGESPARECTPSCGRVAVACVSACCDAFRDSSAIRASSAVRPYEMDRPC